MQKKINSIFEPVTINVELKDVPNFGSPLTDDKDNFRWVPSLDYLQELGEPLRLTAIRTKGQPNHLNTAIQLVFHNGLESDMIDT